MKKRGVSAIVATVLIILITVAGATIIWTAIVPMIQQNLAFSSLEGMVSVVSSEGWTVYDADKEIAMVQVKRNVDDGVMNRIKVIFSIDGDSVGSSVVAPGSGQTKVYTFNLSGYGEPDSVSVAPIFAIGETEKEGSVTSTIKIPSGNIDEVSEVIYNLDGDYFGEGTEGQIITGYSLWKLSGNNIYYNDGDVGIGTKAPNYNLEIKGSLDAAAISINSIPVGTSTDTYWEPATGGINYGGKIGIGTITPTAKLDVQGDVHIYLN